MKCGCKDVHKIRLMGETTGRSVYVKDKILALLLFLSGLSMRATGKIVGVSNQSVVRHMSQIYSRESWYFKAYGGGNG